MKILITGVAGFIGFHLAKSLAEEGAEVVGIDSLNDYYPVSLKYARLAQLGINEEEIVQEHIVRSSKYAGLSFLHLSIDDREQLEKLFCSEHFNIVMNLAAQAGVRYSIENPYAYIKSNVVGFVNLLECVRKHPVQHFVYASSSSVYGGNTKTPFSEDDAVNNQVSVYAVSKRSDELMAGVYSKLYAIPTTGLRFFTVYGPWGRPDMAPMLFTKAIDNGRPIKVFNHGDLSRDFTFISDIIEGIRLVLPKAPSKDNLAEIYNIGCGHPVKLMDFIHTIETAIGKEAEMQMLPMQKGDVHTTYADTSKFERVFGYKAHTDLKQGISQFIEWYKEFYL
jgi:UDP-glucuronate 4-epimerase